MSTSDLLTQNSAHASAAGEGPRPPPDAPSTSFPLLSRTRAAPAEDGEADVTLSLGEFASVPTLSHSEVKFLLNALRDTRKTQSGGNKVHESDCLMKTMDYLGSFARYKTHEQIMAVESAIKVGYEERLEGFEKSQLSSLGPTDADEAFTLIPSLRAKFSDAEMEDITRRIADLKTFE